MKQLPRFEANLLRIVHGVLQRAPLEKVLPLVTERLERPTCLSRQAVELLQDTLAKGTVSLLAREGWRRERFVRGSQVSTGRLWQRTRPEDLGLSFSRHALAFLIWLTSWDQKETSIPPSPPADELTAGDHLLFLLTYRLLHGTNAGKPLRSCEAIASNGMCRLMYPDEFAELPGLPAPQWGFWTSGIGSCIFECFQIALSKRWIDMENSKGKIGSVTQMLALGQSQEQTLLGFLDAVTAAGRRDLARFLLSAYGALLKDHMTRAAHWTGGLKTAGVRLGVRVEANRAALTFLRQLRHLQDWDAQARTVGYFDEGYAASQLWKAEWEKHQGDEMCRIAASILQEIEPLTV